MKDVKKGSTKFSCFLLILPYAIKGREKYSQEFLLSFNIGLVVCNRNRL